MSSAQLDRAPETIFPSLDEASSCRRHFAIMGATIDIHSTLDDTNGGFSIVELRVPPRFPGAPKHLHEKMTESFYMLEGTIDLLKEDTWTSLQPGSFALIPPGTPHGYRNNTDDYARFLVVAPGHDRFFVELVDWMHHEPVWPPTNREALIAFGHRHDTIYL